MIKPMSFRLLQVDEYFNFGQRIVRVFSDVNLEALRLKALVGNIEKALQMLSTSLGKGSVKAETLSIQSADEARDDCFVGLKYYALACSKRKSSDWRKAAEQILEAIRQHGWSTQVESYAKQSTRLNQLIGDLKTSEVLRKAASTIMATEWVNELDHAQNEFETAWDERIEAKAQQPQVQSVEATKAIRTACETLFQYIEIMQKVEPTDEFTEIIVKLNEVITEFMTILNARQTRNENEREAQKQEASQSNQ